MTRHPGELPRSHMASSTRHSTRSVATSFVSRDVWGAHRFRTIPKQRTAARGYGGAHEKARERAKRVHSPADPCARCGHPLGPMGSHLHYDHNGSRTGYLGFSHGSKPCPTCGKRCNLVAAAREGNRRSTPRPFRAQSREW